MAMRGGRNKFLSEMKKCIAFSTIPGSREAWIPCMRDAQAEYALCQRHSDVVAGVMMGICVAGIAEDAKGKRKKQRRAERKRLTGNSRKRRAAEKAGRLRNIQPPLESDMYDLAFDSTQIPTRTAVARHEQG